MWARSGPRPTRSAERSATGWAGTSAAVGRLQREPTVDQPVQRVRQFGRGDLDEEPDVAVVDPEYGHRPPDDEPHRAEHGSVATERDDRVDAVGERVLRHQRHAGTDPLGVASRAIRVRRSRCANSLSTRMESPTGLLG
jgi:hypothetical protein